MTADVRYETAAANEAALLAELRVAAMRPSLEAVGRFDPERARRRFLDKYQPEATRKIILNDRLAGFFVFEEQRNHFWLDHLYIDPEFQGRGLGAEVVRHIQRLAKAKDKAVCLCALKESPSNDFYRQLGFAVQSQQEWDIYYQWRG